MMLDNGFIETWKVVMDLLLERNELSSSIYKVKKTLNHYGIEYEKIHTYPNECILY